MQNPITFVTDKVMRMIKAVVYLAMRVSFHQGATTVDITAFLGLWAPTGNNLYHKGIVERVLFDLQSDGKVTQAGKRWYLVGVPG